MAKTRDCNTPADIGKTLADIIAEGGNFWHLDNVLTDQSIRDSIKLTDTQLVNYLGQLGVGASEKTAQRFTGQLTAQGEILNFDLSSIENPIAQKDIIDSIYEQSGGSTVVAQILTTSLNLGTSGIAYLTLGENADTIYKMPGDASTSFEKINTNTMTSTVITTFASGTRIRQGIYDPISNKIFAVASGGSATGNIFVYDISANTTYFVGSTAEAARANSIQINSSGDLFTTPAVTIGGTKTTKISPAPSGNSSETVTYHDFALSGDSLTCIITSDDILYVTNRSNTTINRFDTIGLIALSNITGNNIYGMGGIDIGEDFFITRSGSTSYGYFDATTGAFLTQVASGSINGLLNEAFINDSGIIKYSNNQGYVEFNIESLTYTQYLYSNSLGIGTSSSWLASPTNKKFYNYNSTNGNLVEVRLDNFLNLDALPTPYLTGENATGVVTNEILRKAQIGVDYELVYNLDLTGNIISVDIEKLQANGQKDIFYNIVTSNAFEA